MDVQETYTITRNYHMELGQSIIMMEDEHSSKEKKQKKGFF